MKWMRSLRSERGVHTLEWVALALVVLALIGVVISYLNGPGGAQVAAPIQQALQRYAWCLEGAGACPGAGWAGPAGPGLPGSRRPGGQPPGAPPPGVQPPRTQPSGLGAPGSGGVLDRIRQWVQDRWEDGKRTATAVWNALKAGAQAAWNWIEEHKGIVAGVVVAGLIGLAIVLGAPIAVPVLIGAALGAIVFGLLYQFAMPREQQTWGEAFLFVAQGALWGGLTAYTGLASLFAFSVAKLKETVVSSAISLSFYFATTPPEKWSIQGILTTAVVAMVASFAASPRAALVLGGILNTVKDAALGALHPLSPAIGMVTGWLGKVMKVAVESRKQMAQQILRSMGLKNLRPWMVLVVLNVLKEMMSRGIGSIIRSIYNSHIQKIWR